MADIETDIPSPINLRSEPEAREWTRTAMLKRPWRAEFFARIAAELGRLNVTPLAILELGSGPGFLGEHILTALPASHGAGLLARDACPREGAAGRASRS